MKIIVTCKDGKVRAKPFETPAEAKEWAEWGHCCLAEHTYKEG